MGTRPLFCIVSSRAEAENALPDLGRYSPKQLADKEEVTDTTVRAWLREGLPYVRQGKRGRIFIYYQDYVNWIIDCARDPDSKVEAPVWAYWFLRSRTLPEI
ncbi:MAG: hypothetical protein IK038_02395 [Bacteroidaceae bacterium]|nr:hypothetical protein [Bacteroidaceae bacterium]